MDVVMKARGERVVGQARARVERKLTRLGRLDAAIDYVEIEVIRETHAGGGHRVEASCRARRRTYRASATGRDLDGALDRLVERLERQITDGRGRRRARLLSGAGRVKSRGMSAFEGRTSPSSPIEPESPR